MQPHRAEGAELAQASTLATLRRDDDHTHDLLQRVMGHREGSSLRHRVMRHQHVLDLRRRNGLAATLDGLLGAPHDEEVSILVQVAVVARLEPAVLSQAHAGRAAPNVAAPPVVAERRVAARTACAACRPCVVAAEERAAAHGNCAHLARR